VQERRRAATKERIVVAGTRLFEARGYADTSISDISAEAGVAARTVYLHFNSKAAILLAYFDGWIDDFVAAICAGPPGENIESAMARSFAVLDAAGKIDDRSFDQMGAPHPVLELLSSSNLDIPGHVLQSWVRAQDTMADHFRRSLGLPPDSVVPRTRAATVFATWMVTLLSYRDAREGRITGTGPLHEVALDAVKQMRNRSPNR
jgi:AcrR family transcriptional regulator